MKPDAADLALADGKPAGCALGIQRVKGWIQSRSPTTGRSRVTAPDRTWSWFYLVNHLVLSDFADPIPNGTEMNASPRQPVHPSPG